MKFEAPDHSLRHIAAFSALGQPEMRRLLVRCYTKTVASGEVLTTAGEDACVMHVIIAGRFACFDDANALVGELGPGAVIAETEFFTRTPLQHTVAAVRESTVLSLEWDEFVHLADRAPEYWRALSQALAVQAAAASAVRKRGAQPARFPKPQTLAIVRAGPRPIPADMLTAITYAFDPLADCQVLTSASFGQNLPGGITLDDPEVIHWLREQNQAFDLVIRVTDDAGSEWTSSAIAEADEILLVGLHDGAASGPSFDLTPVEREAFGVRGAHACRLVIVHTAPHPVTGHRQGAKRWLDGRPVRHHHHILASNAADYSRLARFVCGCATGYIAYGGGAFASAHLGVLQALDEIGLPVDCLGGTGGGAVVAALIASGYPISEALRQFPLPKNRGAFEELAGRLFRSLDIDDMQLPYQALSTDLRTGKAYPHTHGPVLDALLSNWPPSGLASPYPLQNGALLADGSLIDPHPAWLLSGTHSGMNIFGKISVPAQDRQLAEAASPVDWALKRLAGARGQETGDLFEMADFMLRGLGLRDRGEAEDAQEITIAPRLPEGLRTGEEAHHEAAFQAAYNQAKIQLEQLVGQGHPLFKRAPV